MKTSITPRDIALEKKERVLQHMIESHGLRFHATVMGHYVPEFKLEQTQVLGVGMEKEGGPFLWSATVRGTQLLFRVDRAHTGMFEQWISESFKHLATEQCAQFATMPEDIMVYVEVSQCTAGLKSYAQKTKRAAVAA